METIAPTAGAALLGALIGWVLVRWTNIAVARLWAIGLLVAVIVLLALALVRGGERGVFLLVIATFGAVPALIGSVVGMVVSEWRMRKD